MDAFNQWLELLEQRHLTTLNFQEVRRAVQALSALYVERRDRIEQGKALDGAGKRAAFATYFAPLHFLLVQEIVRALGCRDTPTSQILDLACGTGVGGAAWAMAMTPKPRVSGIDRNPWVVREAKWTYDVFGLRSEVRAGDLATLKIPGGTGVIAAFSINELSDDVRRRLLRQLLSAAGQGSPVLVIEPIARRVAAWWPDWVKEWIAAGGREDEWRFPVQLPERLALMDKASGLRHQELTGRSLWIPA